MKKMIFMLFSMAFWLQIACSTSSNNALIEVADSLNNRIVDSTGEYDFGSLPINTTKTEVFNIINIGSGTLFFGVPSVEITGPGASAFSIITRPCSPISSNQNVLLKIQFSPTLTQVYNATIQINTNAKNADPFVFKVLGTGTCAPEINVSQGSSIIPCTTGNYDFGTIANGTTTAYALFTIENKGIAPLNLTGTADLIHKTGSDAINFTIDQSQVSWQIGPSSSTMFSIMFNPVSDGVKSADFGADYNISDVKTCKGLKDIFITKIDVDANYKWTRVIGGMNNDLGNGITTDVTGNVYITGTFSGAVDFGADFNTTDVKTGAGINDIFVTKLTANGNYEWTEKFGGPDNDIGYSLTADHRGYFFITGFFKGTVNFGADLSVSDIKTSAGEEDIFITKLSR